MCIRDRPKEARAAECCARGKHGVKVLFDRRRRGSPARAPWARAERGSPRAPQAPARPRGPEPEPPCNTCPRPSPCCGAGPSGSS
eukprot:15330590-Alexandrium_andersonii.AAC.1